MTVKLLSIDFFKLLVMTYDFYRTQLIFFQNMQLLLNKILIQIMNIGSFGMNLVKKLLFRKSLILTLSTYKFLYSIIPIFIS